MTTLQAQPEELSLKYPKLDFIHLKGKVFGEYNIIYQVNNCYNIKKLDEVRDKHQLLFQRFENQMQQFNLIVVDSIFPNIMADLTLKILLNKICSFNEYINLKKDSIKVSQKWDRKFYRYKFQTFIHYLTFSNINTQEVCIGEIYTDRVYYAKNNSGGIDYYPIYCLHEFQEMLLARMKVKINYSKSYIFNQEANICLELFID